MMKKSQILAALALAMALGVVAPVAGVSAYKVTDNTNGLVGEASCGDVDAAIAAVKATSDYKNIKTYDEAVTAFNKLSNKAALLALTQAGVNTVISDTTTGFDTYFTAINTALTAAGEPTVANVALMTIVNNVNAKPNDTTITTLTSAVTAASNTPGLNKWRGWITELNGGDVRKVAKEVATYYGINSGAGIPLTDAQLLTLGNDILGAASGTYDAYGGIKDAYEDLINAIDNVDSALIADYNTQTKKFSGALKALYDNHQLAATGETAYETEVRDVKFIELTNVLGYATGGHINHYADWFGAGSVEAALDGFDNNCGVYTTDEKENFDDIIALAEAYGKALGSSWAVSDIAAKIVNFKAAAGDPSEDMKPADVTDAPASGVLGTAEGSATTVSIVAGLATALTALGAGVVAYRNARREK